MLKLDNGYVIEALRNNYGYSLKLIVGRDANKSSITEDMVSKISYYGTVAQALSGYREALLADLIVSKDLNLVEYIQELKRMDEAFYQTMLMTNGKSSLEMLLKELTDKLVKK